MPTEAGVFGAFRDVLFTGSGMGGFGALAFSRAAPGARVLAFELARSGLEAPGQPVLDSLRLARKLLPDTEGAGRTRGALSAYSVFGPTEGDMTVAYVSDGNVNPGQGARGGVGIAPALAGEEVEGSGRRGHPVS